MISEGERWREARVADVDSGGGEEEEEEEGEGEGRSSKMEMWLRTMTRPPRKLGVGGKSRTSRASKGEASKRLGGRSSSVVCYSKVDKTFKRNLPEGGCGSFGRRAGMGNEGSELDSEENKRGRRIRYIARAKTNTKKTNTREVKRQALD